jgi:TatD DNase family protein
VNFIPVEKKYCFVDSHCHIDLYQRPLQVIDQADCEHIYTIAVTNTPSVFAHTAALVARSKYVRPAIGLHPELVHSRKHEVGDFRAYLSQTRYVGEIGLDYSTNDEETKSAQRQVLGTIANWVNEYGDRVLTVHSRRAATDVISILRGINAKVILHWFSGSRKELEYAVESEFFFSVNSAMLSSKRGRALVLQMPKERVLTETDGPFVQDRGMPATPITVRATICSLAALWNQSPADVQAKTIQNFREVVKP